MTTTQQPVDPAPDFRPVGWDNVRPNFPSSAEKLGPLWQMLWTLLGRASRPVRTGLLAEAAIRQLKASTGIEVVEGTVAGLLDKAYHAGVVGRTEVPSPHRKSKLVHGYYRLDRWPGNMGS